MSANIPLQCRYPNAYVQVGTAMDHADSVRVQLEFPPTTVRTQVFDSCTIVTELTIQRAYYYERIYFYETSMPLTRASFTRCSMTLRT